MSDVEERIVEAGTKFLSHYGVLGMKWGVRKDGKSRSGKKERRSSTESKRAQEVLKKAKRHGVSSLTNKELGDLNKRLELERKYTTIAPSSSVYRRGMSFATEVLNTAKVGVQAYNVVNSPAAQAVSKAFSRKK